MEVAFRPTFRMNGSVLFQPSGMAMALMNGDLALAPDELQDSSMPCSTTA
jgi:hypothetical protein